MSTDRTYDIVYDMHYDIVYDINLQTYDVVCFLWDVREFPGTYDIVRLTYDVIRVATLRLIRVAAHPSRGSSESRLIRVAPI